MIHFLDSLLQQHLYFSVFLLLSLCTVSLFKKILFILPVALSSHLPSLLPVWLFPPFTFLCSLSSHPHLCIQYLFPLTVLFNCFYFFLPSISLLYTCTASQCISIFIIAFQRSIHIFPVLSLYIHSFPACIGSPRLPLWLALPVPSFLFPYVPLPLSVSYSIHPFQLSIPIHSLVPLPVILVCTFFSILILAYLYFRYCSLPFLPFYVPLFSAYPRLPSPSVLAHCASGWRQQAAQRHLYLIFL